MYNVEDYHKCTTFEEDVLTLENNDVILHLDSAHGECYTPAIVVKGEDKIYLNFPERPRWMQTWPVDRSFYDVYKHSNLLLFPIKYKTVGARVRQFLINKKIGIDKVL